MCASDVAVGPDDYVYLIVRRPGQVVVHDPDGQFVRTFGLGVLSDDPHGITIAGREVICADTFGHVIRGFSFDGELLWTLGTVGVGSDTGVDPTIKDLFPRTASIVRAGPPFNMPTNVAVAANGDLFVSDGYGNTRIHRFSAKRELVTSWGHPGPAAGQFWIVHHVAITADGKVLVCDRGNERIQVFETDGTFIESWTGLQRPACMVPRPDGTVFVGELEWRPGAGSFTRGRIQQLLLARISVLDATGRVVSQSTVTDDERSFAFVSPHGMAIDSQGNLYVADLLITPATEPSRPMVQKFVPVA
jgi:hypothetical protein